MKRILVILTCAIVLILAVTFYLAKGSNVLLVIDSIKSARTFHDESKWRVILKRNRDYLITIKINGEEFLSKRCEIESFALIHVTISESKNDTAIGYINYKHLWDVGLVIGAD